MLFFFRYCCVVSVRAVLLSRCGSMRQTAESRTEALQQKVVFTALVQTIIRVPFGWSLEPETLLMRGTAAGLMTVTVHRRWVGFNVGCVHLCLPGEKHPRREGLKVSSNLKAETTEEPVVYEQPLGAGSGSETQTCLRPPSETVNHHY